MVLVITINKLALVKRCKNALKLSLYQQLLTCVCVHVIGDNCHTQYSTEVLLSFLLSSNDHGTDVNLMAECVCASRTRIYTCTSKPTVFYSVSLT